jgi:hypothetical protein
MKRLQARRGNGRFIRNTPENAFGLHMNIHEGQKPNGEWCGAFNPSKLGEARPEICQCGSPLPSAPITAAEKDEK